MGKAKPAKHTAAEIKAKVHAATTNMGGGKAGLQDRKGGAVGHAKYACPICKTAAPDLKSMQVRCRASCQQGAGMFQTALWTCFSELCHVMWLLLPVSFVWLQPASHCCSHGGVACATDNSFN